MIATSAFLALKGGMGAQHAAVAVAAVILVLAFVSVTLLKETFGQDLDFVEK